jgi:hypothetical protein
LKNDKRAIFTAAGHAQKAADFLTCRAEAERRRDGFQNSESEEEGHRAAA